MAYRNVYTKITMKIERGELHENENHRNRELSAGKCGDK